MAPGLMVNLTPMDAAVCVGDGTGAQVDRALVEFDEAYMHALWNRHDADDLDEEWRGCVRYAKTGALVGRR